MHLLRDVPQRGKQFWVALPGILFPAAWLSPGWRRSPGISLRLDSLSVSAEQLNAGEQVDIALDPALCLTKDMLVPDSARSKLDSIVQLAVRKSLPNGAAGVEWRYEVGSLSGKQLKIRIFLLKTAQLDRLRQQIGEAGAVARTVSVSGVQLNAPFADNRKKLDRARRIWGWLTIASVLTAALFLAGSEVIRTGALQSELAELKVQHRALAAETLAQRQEWENRVKEQGQIQTAAALFLDEQFPLSALLDLTEKLPDETWISEASFEGNRLVLSGFTSGGVPDLIGRLQTLEWVERAELVGQVAFDSYTRQNRFEIQVSRVSKALSAAEFLQ